MCSVFLSWILPLCDKNVKVWRKLANILWANVSINDFITFLKKKHKWGKKFTFCFGFFPQFNFKLKSNLFHSRSIFMKLNINSLNIWTNDRSVCISSVFLMSVSSFQILLFNEYQMHLLFLFFQMHLLKKDGIGQNVKWFLRSLLDLWFWGSVE